MPQECGQSYNRYPMTQCPELPDPCGKQDAHSSPHTSRRQTHGGSHNCPPGAGQEKYRSPSSDTKQTYNCPPQGYSSDTRPDTHCPPENRRETHNCPPDNRRETHNCPPDNRWETHNCPHDSRRETFDIPATPVRGRDTYAMPTRRDDIIAPPSGGKRGTYDVPQNARKVTYGLPHTPRQGTYTPPGSGSPEIPPQYQTMICPDASIDEERRRLKEDFRSMQMTPWTMGESVMTPPWGEGAPPMGGITPGDTMGGCLADYPIREDAPWDRDCDVFSSPDTAVSLSPRAKRGQQSNSRSVSPLSSPPSHPSPRTEYHNPTPCSHKEQPHPTPCSPSGYPRPASPGSSPSSSPCGVNSSYPSSGSPGSIDTGLSSASPGTPSRSCADGPNLVKPTLDDMLCTIKFGAEDFFSDRMQHINDLNLVIMKAIDAFHTAQLRISDFERVMDNGTTMITPFVKYWGNVAEHYNKQRHRCLDTNRPVPNLNIEHPSKQDTNRPVPNLNIEHPSKQVNQGAYCDLLWQMVLASQAAERGARAQDLEYGELDEQLNNITERLRLSLDGLTCHVEKNKRVNDQFVQILTNFNERRRRVLAFLEEWQCGGEELNQPPLSPADIPQSPAIPQICPHDSSSASPTGSTPCGSPSSGGLRNQSRTPPGSGQSTSPTGSTPCGSPSSGGTPEGGLRNQLPASTGQQQKEEAVDRLRERAQALQEMVQRFNDMQSHAMYEVRNIQTQNMMLEQSLYAMENVRSPP